MLLGRGKRTESLLPSVRLWHLTDIDSDAQHVRFRGKADIPYPLSNVR